MQRMLRARIALIERNSWNRWSSTAFAAITGCPVRNTCSTMLRENASSGAGTSSRSKLRATRTSAGCPGLPSTRNPRSALASSTKWSMMIASRRSRCSSLFSAFATRCSRSSRSSCSFARAGSTSSSMIVSRDSPPPSGAGARSNQMRAPPTPTASPLFTAERSTRCPFSVVPFWLPRSTSSHCAPCRSNRQCCRDARRSSTGMSQFCARPTSTCSLSRSNTVRRWFSSRTKRATRAVSARAAGSAPARRCVGGGGRAESTETVRNRTVATGRPESAEGAIPPRDTPSPRRDRPGGAGPLPRRVRGAMPRTYTLGELASLAGIAEDVAEAWEAEGRFGDVERDRATGRPAYRFAHAERAVALGGRTTRRRFSVVNQKGGVGKTTTVFSLAGAFAEIGRRVLAIDLDAQANLTSSFGYDPDTLELTSENLLTEDAVTPEDVILETGVEGVHLIPADIRLCSVDVKIHEMYMREHLLASKLRRLFDHYHVVLIDCPPNRSKVTINALIASQEVIVPVETQSYSIKAISDLTNTFALLKAKLDHALRAWVLPTKVDRRVRLANDFLAALDRHFGAALLDPVGLDANVVKAPMIYEPIGRSFPASRAARDYLRLARFLVLPDAERDACVPPRDRFDRSEDEPLFSDAALHEPSSETEPGGGGAPPVPGRPSSPGATPRV